MNLLVFALSLTASLATGCLPTNSPDDMTEITTTETPTTSSEMTTTTTAECSFCTIPPPCIPGDGPTDPFGAPVACMAVTAITVTQVGTDCQLNAMCPSPYFLTKKGGVWPMIGVPMGVLVCSNMAGTMGYIDSGLVVERMGCA